MGLCCCGCSVREGTRIIAIVLIVIGIMLLSGACFELVIIEDFPDNVDFSSSDSSWLRYSMIFVIVNNGLELIFCVLMLKAVQADNRFLLIPWLTYDGLCIVFWAIVSVMILVMGDVYWFALLFGWIFFIRSYLFGVVICYYKEVLESRNVAYEYHYDPEPGKMIDADPGITNALYPIAKDQCINNNISNYSVQI